MVRHRGQMLPKGAALAGKEKIVADEMIPVSWYAVLTSTSIQSYLDTFELMSDPQLQAFEQEGTKFGKLIYSGFAGYSDYV